MTDTCPSCHADLKGEKIPEKYREHYGSATHFSRSIALYDRDLDMTVNYKCPDCGHVWSRE